MMLRRLLPFAWPRRALVFEATVLLLIISVLDTTVLPFLLAAILLCVVGSAGTAAASPFAMKATTACLSSSPSPAPQLSPCW
jgi:hypothetical protein